MLFSELLASTNFNPRFQNRQGFVPIWSTSPFSIFKVEPCKPLFKRHQSIVHNRKFHSKLRPRQIGMERFSRIVPLLRRNDPIINSLNMSSVDMTDDMTDQLIEALNDNMFISKIVLQSNSLPVEACKKIFGLLLTNPKLVTLEITDNSVNDEGIERLAEVLKQLQPNHEPISLVLRNNHFGPAGAAFLSDALAQNVPVHWLDLRYNGMIGDEGVETLAFSLAHNTLLTGLDLIKCGCNERGAAALADALLDNHTLTTLLIQDDLSLNAVHSLGYLLSDASCHLQALYLWHCQLTQKLMEVLCHSLRGNHSLTTLALSYNKIDDTGGLYLSDMILRNKAIVKLHLGANLFSPTTAGFFGVALARNTTLQFLDLSRNFFRSVGVWPLAVSLMNNRSLRTIDLRYNKIDGAGAEMLCELIAGNSAITVMRLSGNPFGDASISTFALKLVENKTVRELELNDVDMTSQGFVALCRDLKKNRALEKISLSGNRLSPDSLKAFAELLKENTALQMIGMSECMINDEGCQYIAEGIASNSTLGELDLSKNRIDLDGVKLILDAIQGNYTLMKIDLQENPFSERPEKDALSDKVCDFLDRNNYYLHNILMKDMSALAMDDCFM
jgi:Ran GTPase-activating protein (RanGAP) involved in mRNA processing and transport